MDKEIRFAKILEEVKKTEKEQGSCISREQLEEAFCEMELAPEQMILVEDYLEKNKIGIGEPLAPEDYLTTEEINYLEQYLEELAALEKVSEGEKEAITLSAMAGDAQAQARLAEIYLPEVAEIAKLYSGQGVLLEDLIGEGNVAVAAGVSMLGCLEHAAEVPGMLGRLIMDAMEEYIEEHLEGSKADKRVLDKVNQVADAARELAEELHRKITVEELAEESGLEEALILEAMRMSGDKIEHIERE